MAGKGAVSVDIVIKEGKDGLKTLTMDAAALRKIMEGNIKAAQRFEKKVIGFAAFATSINAASNAFGQLSSTLESITGESMEFGRAMKEANTMAGKDSAGFKQLKGEVADLAKEIPIARDQLANGLYQTISNGVPENNWVEFLNTSAKSAVGGLADINKVVGVTSTVIKNYGLEWDAAADIQDKIQLTAKNGVTSFEQLAQALPRVTGNAATLCVSIDELMGTFATLTGVSGNTAEVSTQLAAIFTSLVKPSSEASEMAAKMGIQFDAAAIKAAGGFQNFLANLNNSVKAYAQSTGTLEQEIYGKLFGSAEALRALTPLQGELADKFAANISNMVNSAGTMDAAYKEMASTGGATTQMLRNQAAAVIDVVAGITASAQPYINFASGLLSTGSSAAILINTFKQLNIQQTIMATRSKLASFAMVTLGLRGKSTAAVMRVFSSAMKGGTLSATAFKIALRGLLVASGIGIAIAAVTAVIEHFVNATDDATDSTNKFLNAEERAKREAEQLEQLRQQEASTLTQTRAALELNISKLKEFNGTKEQEKTLVSEMNNTYGETMGYFSSVADWYKALVSNSEAYCRQMAIEARARILANRIAEKKQAIHDIEYDETGKARKYSLQNEKGRVLAETKRGPVWVEGEKANSSDWHKAKADIAEYNKEIAHLESQMHSAAKEAEGLNFAVKGSDVRPDIKPVKTTPAATSNNKKAHADRPVWNENASNLKEIGDNIRILEAQLQTASIEEAALINQQIALWQEKADAIRNAGKAVEDNNLVFKENAATLKEIGDNIRILEDQLQNATQEQAVEINQKIDREQKKADAIRNAGRSTATDSPTYDINADNLKKIGDNISVLENQLQTASIEQAAIINREIEMWHKKEDAIRSAGMAAKANFDTYRSGWNGIKDVGSGIDSITDSLQGNGNAWQTVTGIVDGFLQIYDGIKTIVDIINMLGFASNLQTTAETGKAAAIIASTGAQGAEAVAAEAAAAAQAPVIAANKSATASYMELAAAAYFAAHAYIPFAGFGIASGFVSAAAGIVKAIGAATLMPFADGGIVSGPTVGLIGEYAGASHNPEVVAPLDKLRSIIGNNDSGFDGRVEFEIRADRLYGILKKHERRLSRT